MALEDIRSLYNIGAIFRTCSFFGVKDVLLVGYSGKTREGANVVLHPNVLKSSLGTEKDLNITFLDTSEDLVSFAVEKGLKILAIEQNENSGPLDKWDAEDNSIIVLGNEVTGVSGLLLERADDIIEISRVGSHNSLNVTTVCGITLYHISTFTT